MAKLFSGLWAMCKRVGSVCWWVVGACWCVVVVLRVVLSIPGSWDDGAAWVAIFRRFSDGTMTPLDLGFIVAGVVCFSVGWWVRKKPKEQPEEARTPKTETWISKSEVLKIIVSHPLVFKDSNRRKLPGKHLIEEIQESLKGPSGEAIYTREKDRASARRYLNEIITRLPEAKRGDEYSKEILVYELDITLKIIKDQDS